MSTNNYYHIQPDIQKLEHERVSLKKAYDDAVENDLPFMQTKRIYMRLKEINRELEQLHKNIINSENNNSLQLQ